MTINPDPFMCAQSCLRVLEAMEFEAWQEGEAIWVIEPVNSGAQLATFEANGRGLQAFLEPYQCAG